MMTKTSEVQHAVVSNSASLEKSPSRDTTTVVLAQDTVADDEYKLKQQ